MSDDPRVGGLVGLIRSAGRQPEEVATVLGVSSFLFSRVDAGRQGLPEQFVPRLAVVLGVSVDAVRSATSRLLSSRPTTPFVRAMPARPAYGEALPSTRLHPLGSVNLPPRATPPRGRYVWMSGPPFLIGPSDTSQLLAVADRDTRSLVALRDLYALSGGQFVGAGPLAYWGGRVWCADTDYASGHGMLASVAANDPNGAVQFCYFDAVARPYFVQLGMAGVELDIGAALWKANFENSLTDPHGALQLLAADGSVALSVDLSDDKLQVQPLAVLNFGQFSYVLAFDHPIPNPDRLRWHRVDTVAGSQDAMSAGDVLGGVLRTAFMKGAQVALTQNGVGALWAMTPGAHTSLNTTPLDSFLMANVALSTDLGAWQTGLDADKRDDLWITTSHGIAKVAQDGTVLALIDSTVVPTLSHQKVLACDRGADDCVWVVALLGATQHVLLRIDAPTATVTDTILVLDSASIHSAFDVLLTP